MTAQFDLFTRAPLPDLPAGFRYEPALLSVDEQAALTAAIAPLPFKEFEFHGFLGKRRVVSFGWKYDFAVEKVRRIEDVPEFLLPLRALAAAFAGVDPQKLQQALVTEYSPGAAIGWHKDKAVFDEVVGVSLGAPCTFRLRRKAGSKWERRNVTLEPGSAYLIAGEARVDWEHSIPPVDALRYSVTFRSMREPN
jgi:alkylated DNA repair dioxygenase AlkB